MKETITYNKFIQRVIILSTFFIVILFMLYSNFIQSKNIEENMKDDTNVIANLIFENLYTVMKIGGNKELINETIQKIQNSISHVDVAIIKTDDNKNKSISEVFKTKESQIINQNENIQFITPILLKQECLKCHSTQKTGDVAGVIVINHSIFDIKLSMEDITIMICILFILIVLVFFSTWVYFLRKYFIKPINDLICEISKHKTYEDLKTEITIDTNIKEIQLLGKAFNEKNSALYTSITKLEKASNNDHLTGIYNRKKFTEYSTLLINKAKRYDNTFSLVLIDLNKFKPINDSYGHDVGDKVLIFFTQIIKESIRETDYFFRMGGDEFCLLFSNTAYWESEIVVSKLQHKLENSLFIEENIELKIGASFGIAQYKIDGINIDDLEKVADTRMYQNKRAIEN